MTWNGVEITQEGIDRHLRSDGQKGHEGESHFRRYQRDILEYRHREYSEKPFFRQLTAAEIMATWPDEEPGGNA